MERCEGYQEGICKRENCKGCDWDLTVLRAHADVVAAATVLIKQMKYPGGVKIETANRTDTAGVGVV